MMTGFVHSLGRVNDDGVTYTCGPSGVAPNGQAGAMPESMPRSAAQRRLKAQSTAATRGRHCSAAACRLCTI